MSILWTFIRPFWGPSETVLRTFICSFHGFPVCHFCARLFVDFVDLQPFNFGNLHSSILGTFSISFENLHLLIYWVFILSVLCLFIYWFHGPSACQHCEPSFNHIMDRISRLSDLFAFICSFRGPSVCKFCEPSIFHFGDLQHQFWVPSFVHFMDFQFASFVVVHFIRPSSWEREYLTSEFFPASDRWLGRKKYTVQNSLSRKK